MLDVEEDEKSLKGQICPFGNIPLNPYAEDILQLRNFSFTILEIKGTLIYKSGYYSREYADGTPGYPLRAHEPLWGFENEISELIERMEIFYSKIEKHKEELEKGVL